ncbi:hypothetical protein F2P56_019764 [Juglans regia]|uniref:Uncharacterized protein n=1 Tax=Juglans regia TaxID=51240 RepID=A0A833XAC3_JUGRE|nr:hypothetical protein F2P56_019764 [Juglans regia]
MVEKHDTAFGLRKIDDEGSIIAFAKKVKGKVFFAHYLFDVLPLKVVFEPSDREMERTHVGINSDGLDVMEELGLGSDVGNILKMYRLKYVKVAYHGFRELSKEEKVGAYGNMLLRDSFDGPNYALIDTFLLLVEAYLFARNEDIEDKPKDNSDPSTVAVVQGTAVKTTVKKKIIKRMAKSYYCGFAPQLLDICPKKLCFGLLLEEDQG